MLPETMLAAEIAAPGAAAELISVTTPLPVPGAGQVLVHNEFAGVNFYDTYVRSGVYPAQYPLRPGIDGAGIVVAVGPGVSEEIIGERFAYWGTVSGAYAQYAAVKESQLLAAPTHIDSATLAALPTQALTAHMLIDGTYPVREGTQMFITAGAGGVGNLAIQLAKARGARIITTVSTPQKAELARKAGADHVIFYRGLTTQELTQQIRAASEGGQGVDVAFDGVGATTFEASLSSLRARGTLVLFGGASGQVPPFDLQRLNQLGSLFITRPSLAPYMASASERQRRWEEVTSAVVNEKLTARIGGLFPLSQAGQAHELLESGTSTGKLLLATT